jgi:hypothetical protein
MRCEVLQLIPLTAALIEAPLAMGQAAVVYVGRSLFAAR